MKYKKISSLFSYLIFGMLKIIFPNTLISKENYNQNKAYFIEERKIGEDNKGRLNFLIKQYII